MSGIIGGLVAVILVGYLVRRAATSGVPGQLRHGVFLKVFAWIMAAATVGLAYVMLFTNHRGQYGALTLLIVGFGLGAGYLLLEAYGTRGHFNAEEISFRTAWTGQKTQRFRDLVLVEYRPRLGRFDLKFQDGTTIHLSTLIFGHALALEEAYRYLTSRLSLGQALRGALHRVLPSGWIYLPEVAGLAAETPCVFVDDEDLDDEAQRPFLTDFPREGLSTDLMEQTGDAARRFADPPSDELLIESFDYYRRFGAFLPNPGASE